MNFLSKLSLFAASAATLFSSSEAFAANGTWTTVHGQIKVMLPVSAPNPALGFHPEPTVLLDATSMGGAERLPRMHYRITGKLAEKLAKLDGMTVSFKGYAIPESTEGNDFEYELKPRINARVTLTGTVEELGMTTDMQGTHKLVWTDRDGNERSMVLDAADSADADALDALMGTAVTVTGKLGSTVESGNPILAVRDVARFVEMRGASGSNVARNENTTPTSAPVAQRASTGAGVQR